MFKKRPTKAELRDQLSAEVSQFLKKGGEIKQVEMGASGLVDGRYNQHKARFDHPKPAERTPIHGLLAAIDARRKSKLQPGNRKTTQTSPRKKVIYDDFGEPVRTVWVDE
ncbi:hypothetical protein [Neptuniibacter halophilus]|uniref:hypothetical protein n=1 Tax=Neptuniibacter halophilus TaxID=651666 RepID=UPI002572EF33|nr:hypothetical protein [Neptuniibacter halophilus]